MPKTAVNGIELTYEVSGNGPPLLLIMGLGGQLTDWPPEFVYRLGTEFTVIRFDNRDSGLSTHATGATPTRWELIKGHIRRGSVPPAYTLDDMADDASGLITALGYSSAHVVGMSMGGMIAQVLALRNPAQVRTLTSIMSTTGNRRVGRPTARVIWSLVRRGEPSRDEALGITIDLFRLVGGADWDEAEQRRRTTASLARAYNPLGVLRQTQAIAAAVDRTDALHAITNPTLVLHGLDDTLVRPSGGTATARAIASSRLLMFPRMGHDLPATRHQEIVDAICENAARATS